MLSKNTNLLPQVASIHYATRSQLLGYLQGQDDPNAIFPVLGSGTWSGQYFSVGSIQYTEGSNPDPHGPVYQYQLSLTYPGLAKENYHVLAAMDNEEWILLIQFCDGHTRILGSEDKGCEFFWDFDLERKGFTLSFTLRDSRPAYNFEYIAQFFVNDDQHLVQLFQDDNTYSVNADQHFIMEGPQSPYYKKDKNAHLVIATQ